MIGFSGFTHSGNMNVREKKDLLNTKKTKIVVIDKQSGDEEFLLDGQVIEEVSDFGISWVTY